MRQRFIRYAVSEHIADIGSSSYVARGRLELKTVRAIDALERLSAEESLGSLANPIPYIAALAHIADFLPRKKVMFISLAGDSYARGALVPAESLLLGALSGEPGVLAPFGKRSNFRVSFWPGSATLGRQVKPMLSDFWSQRFVLWTLHGRSRAKVLYGSFKT